MSSAHMKKKKAYATKGGSNANSTIIHCNGKSSGSSKKLYHKNDELMSHSQSQHHPRYKTTSIASTGTRILHKRHNVIR